MSPIHFFFFLTLPLLTLAQQPYINNNQLNCLNDSPSTKGFKCLKTTLNSTSSSCLSYATFRTTNTYNTTSSISLLLSTSVSQMSRLNNLSSTSVLPSNTLLLVPLPSCTCSSSGFYEHVAVYTKKRLDETYFTTVNVTFQGLSTCQAVNAKYENEDEDYHWDFLQVGDRVNVPLRCACPSKNQTMAGFRYLLSYIVTWGDTIDTIAEMFGADSKSIWAANELEGSSNLIFPFTTLLVPLKSEPVINTSFANPPDPSSPNMHSVKGNNSSRKCLFIGVSVIGSLLSLVGLWFFRSFLLRGITIIPKVVKMEINKRRRAKFFKKNGGLLLQQQLLSGGNNKTTKVFRSYELEKATNLYNMERVIGQGGQGIVYKGILSDGTPVAVKASKIVDKANTAQFINELVILSQINHRNVVKLLGCCLETEVPMLVYEFISNGTLFQHIQNPNEEFPLTWERRLQIAMDIARSLSYLHNAASIPIYHRDIKSNNIMLDDRYEAKVCDFGISRSVDIEKTHLTTQVKGTFGYLDPEYFHSSQFNEKSDVYSFGVVLVEFLTGKKPIFSDTSQELRGLAPYFLESMQENRLLEMIDPQLCTEEKMDEIVEVSHLAKACLNSNGKKRPTMKEVAAQLERIRMHREKATPHENEETEYSGEDFDDYSTSSNGSMG